MVTSGGGLHGCRLENQRVCLVSNDGSAGDDLARRASALRASLIAALSEMLEELEVLRQRQAAPPEIDEFMEHARATLARLQEEALPEDPPA